MRKVGQQMKKYSTLIIVCLINIMLIVNCQYNEYSPFNLVDCDDGNVNGRTKKNCDNEKENKKMIFYALFGIQISKHKIIGILSDSNGTILTNYNLVFQSSSTSSLTDNSGNFYFSLSSGTYIISVSDPNGNSVGSFTITVSRSGEAVVTINSGSIQVKIQ